MLTPNSCRRVVVSLAEEVGVSEGRAFRPRSISFGQSVVKGPKSHRRVSLAESAGDGTHVDAGSDHLGGHAMHHRVEVEYTVRTCNAREYSSAPVRRHRPVEIVVQQKPRIRW